MLSDYNRTTELLSVANNSAGASQEQFNKTLESLQSKLERLSNAWTEFSTGIANNAVIKSAVDLLTGFLNALNFITQGIGPANTGIKNLTGTILKLTVTVAGFKGASKVVDKFFFTLKETGKPMSSLFKTVDAGAKKSLNSFKKLFSKDTWAGMSGASSALRDFEKSSAAFAQMSKNGEKIATTITQNINNQAAYAAALGLSNDQTAIYNSLIEKGYGAQDAASAALGGLNAEILKGVPIKAADEGLTEEQTAALEKQTVAQYAQKGAEELNNRTTQMGLLTKMKYYAMLLFGTKKIRENAMQHLIDAGAIKVQKVATDQATTAQQRLNEAMLENPIGPYILLIAALIAGLAVLAKLAYDASPEQQFKKTKEMMEKTSEEIQSAKERLEEMTDQKDSLEELTDEFENLTAGTDEWKQKLIEVNNQVLDLIDKYPLLRQYLEVGEYGALKINEEGWNTLIKQQRKTAANGQAALQYWTTKNDKAAADIKEEDVREAESHLLTLGSTEGVYEFSRGGVDTDDGEKFADSYEEWVSLKKEAGTYIQPFRDYIQEQIAEGVNVNSDDFIRQTADTYMSYEENVRPAISAIQDYNSALKEQELAERQTAKALQISYFDATHAASEYADSVSGMFTEGLSKEKYDTRVEEIYDELKKKSDFKDNDLFKEIADEYHVTDQLTGGGTHDVDLLYATMKGIDVNDIDENLKRNDKVRAIASIYFSEQVADVAQKTIDVFEKQAAAENVEEKQGNKENDKKALDKLQKGGADIGELTKDQIEALSGEDATSTIEDGLNLLAQAVGMSTKDYLKAMGYDDINEYIEKRKADADKAKKQLEGLTGSVFGDFDTSILKGNFNNLIKNMTYSAAKSFGEMFQNILLVDGTEGAQAFVDSFNEAFTNNGNLSDAQKQQLKETIATFDYANQPIEELGEEIKDLGYNIPTDIIDTFISQMDNLGGLARQVDLSKVSEQLKSLNKIAYDIGKGDQTNEFDEETMNSLISAGVAKREDFTLDASGTYNYIGAPMMELRAAILDNTDALLGRGIQNAAAKNAAGEAINNALSGTAKDEKGNSLKEWFAEENWDDRSKEEKQLILRQMAAYGVEQAATEGISADDFYAAIGFNPDTAYTLVGDKLEEKYQEMMSYASGAAHNAFDAQMDQDKRESIEMSASQAPTFTNVGEIEDILNKYKGGSQMNDTDADDLTLYANVLANQAQKAGVARGEIDKYQEAVEDAKNGDKEARKEVMELSKELAKTANTKKATQAYDELKDTVDDVFDALNGPKDSKYDEAISDIASKATTLFGVNVDTDFVKENMNDFKALRKGGEEAEEAYKRLAVAAYEAEARQALVQADLKYTGDLANQIATAKYELKMSGTADFTPILTALVAAGVGVDQLGAKFNEIMGLKIDFKATGFDLTRVELAGKNGKIQDGYVPLGPDPSDSSKVIMYKPGTITTNGDGGYNPKIFSPAGSSSSSGGSGGGSSDDDKYEPEYDKYYNLVEDLNEELRKRNKLEREYNLLIEDRDFTTQQLLDKTNQQLSQLSQEKKLQTELLNGRKQEMRDYIAENSALQKYAIFNWADNTIEINRDLIYSVTDSEQGKKIDDYISELERIQDDMDEAQDNLDDIEDSVREIKDRFKEEYADFEQKVYDAIVQARQDEIDSLTSLNETISDAASELLDGIQERLDKIREDRENEKTEEELADKEARLAYLRLDTSNANAVEIRNLEKELEEGQEDYTDTLIDQKISELEEQNDEAAKQRERQIKLLEDTLSIDQQTGRIWSEAYDLMKNDIDKNGHVKPGSQLDRYLKNAEEYYQMSVYQQEDWTKETNAAAAQSKAYLRQGQQARNDFDVMARNLGITKDTDIQSEITKALRSGDIQRAAGLERARNAKIDSEGLPYAKTYSFQGNDYSEIMRNINPEQYPKAYYSAWRARWNKIAPNNKWAYLDWADYSVLMTQAHNAGDDDYAALAEYFRNKKITEQKLGYKKTYTYHSQPDAKGNATDPFLKKYKLNKYESGGLATTTGPAWLDGTLSKPEIVLNAEDTRNFLALTDVLRAANRSVDTGKSTGGDSYYDIDINVNELSNDYEVDQVAEEVERIIHEKARWRNDTVVGNIR